MASVPASDRKGIVKKGIAMIWSSSALSRALRLVGCTGSSGRAWPGTAVSLPLLAAFGCIVTIALGGLGGCTKHRTLEEEVVHAARNVKDTVLARTFETHDPVEIKTKGPVAVEVDNFAGDVVVRADRKVEKAVVEVRRVATHGLGRRNESRDDLYEPRWTARLRNRDDGGQTLAIATVCPGEEDHFQRMEVLVLVPSLDTVSVRTTKGDVTVIENQGSVDIETTRGDVRMMTPWPMTGPMTIVTSEGSIDYRVRGESKGVFDCESHGGEVRQRCEYGHWLALDAGNDHDRFYAVLNGGSNPVVLRTTDEDIRVAVVPNPTAVGVYIIDP